MDVPNKYLISFVNGFNSINSNSNSLFQFCFRSQVK